MLKAITFQNHPAYEMSHGESTIRIAPQYGARLIDWNIAGKNIIYWPEDANWTRVAGIRGGNPILFPFIARHMVNSEIGWWIDKSGIKRALPMHGFARDMEFSIIPESDPSTIRLRLLPTEKTREYYPFEFIFDVVYKLGAAELESRLEVTNTGDTPMPYYMGHHYYFSVPHQDRSKWEVKIPCERRGRQNPDGSVDETPATTDTFSLADPTLSDTMQVGLRSHNLSLLNKETDKGILFELNAGGNAPWYAVTTWAEKPESDYYCVEPWTALPNAIHHGKGLRYLEPGKQEKANCIIKAKI